MASGTLVLIGAIVLIGFLSVIVLVSVAIVVVVAVRKSRLEAAATDSPPDAAPPNDPGDE